MVTLSKAQPAVPPNRNVTGAFVTDINAIKCDMAHGKALDQIVEAGRRADRAIDRGRPRDIVQVIRANPKKLIEPVEAWEGAANADAGEAQALRASALVQAIRQALPDSRTGGVEQSLSEIEIVLTARVAEIDAATERLGSDEPLEQAMTSAITKVEQRATTAWQYVPIIRSFVRRSIRRLAHHATKLQSDWAIRRLRRIVARLIANSLRSQSQLAGEHKSRVRALRARLAELESMSPNGTDHSPARDTMLPGIEINTLAEMVFAKQVPGIAQRVAESYPDIDAIADLTRSLSEGTADASGAVPTTIEDYLNSGLVRRDQLLTMADAKARAFAAIDNLVDPWRPRVQLRVVEAPGGERSESSQMLSRLNEHGIDSRVASSHDDELIRVSYTEAMIALPELKPATAAVKLVSSQLNADALASKCTIWSAEQVLAYTVDVANDEQDDHRLVARLIALGVLGRSGDGDCWYMLKPELRGRVARLGTGGLIARGVDALLVELRTDKDRRRTLEEIAAEKQQAKGIGELRRVYRATMRRPGLVPEFYEQRFLQALHEVERALPAVDEAEEMGDGGNKAGEHDDSSPGTDGVASQTSADDNAHIGSAPSANGDGKSNNGKAIAAPVRR